MAETIIVELGTKHFQEANAAVRAALAEADTVCIVEAYAQRYLGCTLPAGKRLEIHGTPGNDLPAIWTAARWKCSERPGPDRQHHERRHRGGARRTGDAAG